MAGSDSSSRPPAAAKGFPVREMRDIVASNGPRGRCFGSPSAARRKIRLFVRDAGGRRLSDIVRQDSRPRPTSEKGWLANVTCPFQASQGTFPKGCRHFRPGGPRFAGYGPLSLKAMGREFYRGRNQGRPLASDRTTWARRLRSAGDHDSGRLAPARCAGARRSVRNRRRPSS